MEGKCLIAFFMSYQLIKFCTSNNITENKLLVTNQLNYNITCGSSNPPKSRNDCNRFNEKDFYCCFLQPIEEGNNICYKIESSKYYGDPLINFLHKSYSVYCGLGTNQVSEDTPGQLGSSCGLKNPLNEKDCRKFSTSVNSCCYYDYDGLKGCYWLGDKYYGTTNNNQIVLSCCASASNLFIAYILISLILTLI